MTDRDMRLGTIFTGRMDATFMTAIRRMRTAITQNINLAAQQGRAMGGVATATTQAATAARAAVAPTQNLTKAHSALEGRLGQVSGAMDRIKRAMKVTASYGIAGTAIFAVINALKSGVTEIIEFDQALKNLEAITGATTAQISVMKDVLTDVAVKTKFSTTELAKGMVLLGQAGFSAEESINALPAVADLAAGTLSDMTLVTDLLTTTIRAWNMDTIESGRVADVMANAINKSKLTIDKLRIAFNFVGAAAAQSGISLEQTAATMMIMANNGLRASTIGTGLRQVLARLMSPNRRLREEFEALGVNLDDVNPRLAGYEKAIRNLIPVIWDFQKKTVDMSKAYELFGLRGAQAAAVLAKGIMSGKFDEMLQKTYEVGTAAAMAATQKKGLAFQIKNLSDKAGVLAIALGDAGVAGVMRDVVWIAGSLVGGLADLTGTIGGKLTLQFITWTAAIWGATKAITALYAATMSGGIIAYITRLQFVFAGVSMWAGKAAGAMAVFKIVLASTGGPLVWIAAAIAGVVVAIRHLTGAHDRYIAKINKTIVEQSRVIQSLKVYIGAFQSLQDKTIAGEDVGREYSSLLQRLQTDHKDLAASIDLTTLSQSELIEKTKEFMQMQSRKKLRDTAEALRNISEKATELDEYIAGGRPGRTVSDPLNIAGLDYDRKVKKRKKYIEDLKKLENEYVDVLMEEVELRGFTEVDVGTDVLKRLEGLDPEVITRVIDRVRASFAALERSQSEMVEAIQKKVKGLPPTFKAVYEKLDAYDQILFIREYGRYEKRIAADKKLAEASLKSGSTTQKKLDAGRIRLEEEFLNAWDSKINKEEYKLNKSRAQEKAKLQDELNKYLINSESDKAAKIEEKYKQDLDAITENYAMRKELAEGNKWELLKIEEETSDALEAIRLKRIKDLHDLSVAELKKHHDKDLTLKADEAAMVGFYSGGEKEATDADKELWKSKFELADEYYKKGKISQAEYILTLERAWQHELITFEQKELLKQQLTATGFERFKMGLENAKVAARTWGETLQMIGENAGTVMADGVVDGLFEFIDKTKSAKDAFVDFARSTISWLMKMIIRQQILNALQGTPGTKGGGILGWIKGLGGGPAGHSGGTGTEILKNWKGPQFHSGYNSNEFMAKLRKDETVFTPGQMASLEGMFKSKSTGPQIINNFKGATFLDKEQLMSTMAGIARQQAAEVAPNAVIKAYRGDHPIRGVIRAGK